MSLFNTIIIAIAIVAFGSATDTIDSADVGLNANLILADSVTTPSVCNKGFVECLDGDEVIDGAITERTCHEACEESCCSGGRGLDACDNFSGLVCKDGSCNASNGGNVCKDASIERVINSCIGRAACRNAGSNEGFVGDVVDSCQGDMACENAGSDGGYIGIIQNSCTHGNQNCVDAGANGGKIGIIKNSCRHGNRNCHSAVGDGGFIGWIDDSCKFGDRNCFGLAAEEGRIDYIVGSCSGTEDDLTHDSCTSGEGVDIHGIEDSDRVVFGIDCRGGMAYANGVNTEQSCREACTESGGSCCIGEDACDNFTGLVRQNGSCIGRRACYRANIGLVFNSCVGVDSCYSAGYDTDAGIGSMKNSCQGESACASAAYEGSIRTIENSCRGLGACDYAADGGSIDSIDNSCNYGEYNCAGVASYGGSIDRILSSCSGTAADPVNDACYRVGYRDDIGDILSCCNGEDEICCHSSACSVTVTTLPEACAPDLTVGIRGFARRFADE